MSSRGPASSGDADVLLACGNGAFACAGAGPGCLSAAGTMGVKYWGMSAVELPAGNATNPIAPADFYAPYTQNYTCVGTGCTPSWDPSPAAYETEELSRVDQDFGTGGMTVIPQPGNLNFVVTADKAGFIYVMPPPEGEVGSSSLGLFQPGDAGLTGSSLSYATQAPFRASRLPTATNPSVCPSVDANGQIGLSPIGASSSCDEVHEVAYEASDNLIFIWPAGETIMTYQGALTVGAQTTYKFGVRNNQCSGGATSCPPHFPAADPASAGGAMAVAVDTTTTSDTCTTLPCITLWSIVPQPNTGTPPVGSLGSLYAYSVGSTGSLTHLWDSPTNPSVCTDDSGVPNVTSWYSTSFTEPTLADVTVSGTKYGAVYVPVVCAVVGGTTTYPNCGSAPSTASGVLVFSTCP